jgi:outer membrane protein TolC
MKATGGILKNPLILVIFFGLLCSMEGSAWSQGRRVLNLDQLIQMALDYSPSMREADQDIASAQGDLRQAKAAQWVQLDALAVGGVVGAADKPITVVNPRPGRDGLLRGAIEKPDDDPGDMGPFGRLEFSVIQPLYTFGKISHRKEAAQYGVDVQRAAREKTRGEVILRVKEFYFGMLLAQQGKEAAADIQSFIDDGRQRIRRLLQLGSTSVDESDLYRLEAYAAEAKRFKAKAEAGASLAYLALKRTIGVPPGEEFELDVKELPKDVRALGNQQEYIQKALQSRPEFEQIEKGLEARRNLVEAAKADLYPSIFAAGIGTLAGAPNREYFDEPYIGDDFNRAKVGIVLGAKWHWDLGILQGKVDKARAEYLRLVQTKDFATLNIPIEVAKYYQDAMENMNAFRASEEATAASRKWIVVAFANFDMGVGQARDIFFALDRYGSNYGDYLLSLLKYHLALASLSYAIGEYRMASK